MSTIDLSLISERSGAVIAVLGVGLFGTDATCNMLDMLGLLQVAAEYFAAKPLGAAPSAAGHVIQQNCFFFFFAVVFFWGGEDGVRGKGFLENLGNPLVLEEQKQNKQNL